jgi:cobalt/nickel transport system permease protein
MVSVHVLIGIGEAIITGLAVSSIVAVRPDLVYGARRVLAAPELVLRTTDRRSVVPPEVADPAEEAQR